MQAMGLTGISKSTVSKLCVRHGFRADGDPWLTIDERVGEFLDRPLTGDWPCLRLDATDLKVRQGGRIVSIAAIIAVAVNTDGRREIIGLGTGPSEAQTFWTEFLRGIKARGLDGVKLVISDAHTGLKAAIARVFDAAWQRCRVGPLKNAAALSGIRCDPPDGDLGSAMRLMAPGRPLRCGSACSGARGGRRSAQGWPRRAA